MDTIGYVVTNKFIIVAAEGRFEITILNSDETSQTLTLNNARKIYTIGSQLAISVLGIPTKITDIYNYILNLQYRDQTFDSILEDLTSIYNTDPNKIVAGIKNLLNLLNSNTGENDVLDIEKLKDILKVDPDTLTILEEGITLQNTVGSAGLTKVLLFARENNRNVFGDYRVLGFNIVGNKVQHIEKDQVFFNIQSSVINAEKLENYVSKKQEELQE